MDQAWIAIAIPVGILLIIIWYQVSRCIDEDRIRRYIRDRGGDVHSIRSPWFALDSDENSSRYDIRYVDRDGNIHEVRCKTSSHTGVYFSKDEIVQPTARRPATDSRIEQLEAENRRLREDLLKAQQQIERRDD